MIRVIAHLDMDAFYASIEQRDNPGLKGKPVVVGSPPDQRGVVCAASYEARKFGVRSALPSATALRLCPQAIFIRPRMDHYREESRRIMESVAKTGAIIEQISIDEAYLDLTELCEGNTTDEKIESAIPIGRGLKETIKNSHHLTASIGIAANKLLAKIASDHQKPDGLFVIRESEKVGFLKPLPVSAIHGVGRKTAEILHGIGIQTIADLQNYQGDLRSYVGSFGPTLKQYARGEDDRPLDLSDEIKSISCEETFSRDTADRSLLRKELREQADDIAFRLKRRRLGALTVQVKVRYRNFVTLTRQCSVEEPIEEAKDIYRLGCFLLARHQLVREPLRLLGLGVSGLVAPSSQMALPLA